jgi:hypothetical protein
LNAPGSVLTDQFRFFIEKKHLASAGAADAPNWHIA